MGQPDNQLLVTVQMLGDARLAAGLTLLAEPTGIAARQRCQQRKCQQDCYGAFHEQTLGDAVANFNGGAYLIAPLSASDRFVE